MPCRAVCSCQASVRGHPPLGPWGSLPSAPTDYHPPGGWPESRKGGLRPRPPGPPPLRGWRSTLRLLPNLERGRPWHPTLYVQILFPAPRLNFTYIHETFHRKTKEKESTPPLSLYNQLLISKSQLRMCKFEIDYWHVNFLTTYNIIFQTPIYNITITIYLLYTILQ